MDKHLSPENAQVLMELKQSTVYMMGASFVLGSMFTLFLLLVLDFTRSQQAWKRLAIVS